MKTSYLIIILFLIYYCGYTQTPNLCPEIVTHIKIKDTDNIPDLSDNGDGTITLTHTEKYITDIFASYVIYDFYRYFPNADPTSELSKYYTITFQSKNLINEMKQNIPSKIFDSYSSYNSSPIDTGLVDFLDGKKFKLTSENHTSGKSSESKRKDNIPSDFDLRVEFNYDNKNDLLLMESIALTPCDNSFLISLKGGENSTSLQLWKINSSIISETATIQSCSDTENSLYSMLDISCLGYNYGDITASFNEVKNTLTLHRYNVIFGDDIFTFEEDVLSVDTPFIEDIKLIRSQKNHFIKFSNIKERGLYVEIFSVLGEKITGKIPYQNNTISLNSFQSGLYFIKLTNSNNNHKIFKYLR